MKFNFNIYFIFIFKIKKIEEKCLIVLIFINIMYLEILYENNNKEEVNNISSFKFEVFGFRNNILNIYNLILIWNKYNIWNDIE